METRVDEIADGIYRLSTLVPEVAPPAGFTFNQFLVKADEPLLFHAGLRQMFPLVSEAAGPSVVPVEQLRWITFGHVESDECGSMNDWLAVAPQRARSPTARSAASSRSTTWPTVRRARSADGEVLDLGGKRVRHFDTPHVPHGWEAAGALRGDDQHPALRRPVRARRRRPARDRATTSSGRRSRPRRCSGATSLTPATAPTIRKLAELQPTTLAIMHGSSFTGDGAGMLHGLADAYAKRLADAER